MKVNLFYASIFHNLNFPLCYIQIQQIILKSFVQKRRKRKAEIIYSAKRMGFNESIYVDNLHSGGFTSEINCLGEMKNRIIKFDFHPDTRNKIKGMKISN